LFDFVKLHVQVNPNAKQNSIVGWEPHQMHGRVLRLRIAAPPREGKANEAIVALLAKELGVSKSSVSLEKGSGSREKTLHIPDHCVFPESWNQ
jgi:uncharacterized protein (TIGR00251 family)